MKNEIVIHLGIKDYKCYKRLEASDSNKEYINDKLQFLRNTLSQMNYSTGKKLVEYDVYVYESNEMNALSSKVDGGYAIALSSEMFLGFQTELEGYLRNRDIRNYFYGKKLTIKKHVEKITDYILLFTVLHENYHILNGHCDTSYSYKKAMAEYLVKGNPEKNHFNQVLELDADFCAVRSLTYLIKERKFTEEDEKIEFIIMGFSLYYIFLKFQEAGYENIQTIKDMSLYSHPPASTRIVYAFLAISMYLGTNYDNKYDYYVELNILSELCIYFDRIYYDGETIDLTLIAFAYTKKGVDYLEGLHNEWNEVKKILEPHAFIKLRTNEPLDTGNMYFLDDKGKFIPEKVNNNMERLLRNLLM